MRIDQKYFNRFIFILALIGAALIVVFTLWQQESREEVFERQLSKQADSLVSRYLNTVTGDDSLQIKQFSGRWVILDFWATWAPQSRQSHQLLNRLKKKHDSSLVVISAASQDPVDEITAYIEKHQYPFHFVDGRQLYKDLYPPGVPTQIIYDPDGNLQYKILGYQDSSQYQPLIEELQKTKESHKQE